MKNVMVTESKFEWLRVPNYYVENATVSHQFGDKYKVTGTFHEVYEAFFVGQTLQRGILFKSKVVVSASDTVKSLMEKYPRSFDWDGDDWGGEKYSFVRSVGMSNRTYKSEQIKIIDDFSLCAALVNTQDFIPIPEE